MNKRLEKIVAKLQNGERASVRRDQITKAIIEGGFDYFIYRGYDEVYSTEPQQLKASIDNIEEYWLRNGDMWAGLNKDKNMLEITIKYGYSYMELWASVEDEKEEITSVQENTEMSADLNITVTYNEEKSGIELRFQNKPQELIRTSMKENGFRYSKPQNIWYAKNTKERREFVNELINNINKLSENNLHTEEEINNVTIIEELDEVATTEEQTEITTVNGNIIKVGLSVTGFWGAMHPYSYGTIIKVSNDTVTIKWSEDDEYLQNSIEDIDVLKFGRVEEIGIYVKEESKINLQTDINTIIEPVIIEVTEIQPLSIQNVEDQNIRVKGIFASLNKNNTIEEYREEVQRDSYINTCKITDIVTLTPQDYEKFVHNFLTDFDFIAGKGGSNSDFETDKENFFELTKEEAYEWRKQSYNLCVMIKAEGKESILINPEGYNYSRYVGFLEQEPQDTKEPIKETKVINISKNNPINNNMSNTDTSNTKEPETAEESIKQLFKDALNELIQDQLPQFKHEIKYKKARVIDFGSYKQKKA